MLLLGGCSARPLLSEKGYTTHVLRADLEAWAAGQADAAIAATGLREGWMQELADPPRSWEAERAEVLVRAGTELCRMTPEEPRPRRIVLTLYHEGVEDYLEVAERVRVFWLSEGWEVRDVVRPEDVAPPPYLLFRADRIDGTGVAFRASERVFHLTLFSACSDNATVRR